MENQWQHKRPLTFHGRGPYYIETSPLIRSPLIVKIWQFLAIATSVIYKNFCLTVKTQTTKYVSIELIKVFSRFPKAAESATIKFMRILRKFWVKQFMLNKFL